MLDGSICEADVYPSRDSSSSHSKPLTAGQLAAVDRCSLKDLTSISPEQLLQLCQAQAVENAALKAGMQWLAASRDATVVSSKEEAACHAESATAIAQLQAECADLRNANTSQSNASQRQPILAECNALRTISSLKKQVSDLQHQLAAVQCGAGKWRASYALLKTQAQSKYAAAVQESEAAIDNWVAHANELQQQAKQAAAKYAALHSRHQDLLTNSEQLMAEYGTLYARLNRRDATISKQRLQLQQLSQGAAGNTDATGSESSSAPAAAALCPAAAAAQNIHCRNEHSGYRKRRSRPRAFTKSRLSACSSDTTACESTMPAACESSMQAATT
jgi:hypothetical protein